MEIKMQTTNQFPLTHLNNAIVGDDLNNSVNDLLMLFEDVWIKDADWKAEALEAYAKDVLSQAYWYHKENRNFTFYIEGEFQESTIEKLLAYEFLIEIPNWKYNNHNVGDYKITEKGIQYLFVEKL
jgi:hypothetical protein